MDLNLLIITTQENAHYVISVRKTLADDVKVPILAIDVSLKYEII